MRKETGDKSKDLYYLQGTLAGDIVLCSWMGETLNSHSAFLHPGV